MAWLGMIVRNMDGDAITIVALLWQGSYVAEADRTQGSFVDRPNRRSEWSELKASTTKTNLRRFFEQTGGKVECFRRDLERSSPAFANNTNLLTYRFTAGIVRDGG
uniref:Uncharacterized protein n=1 Tax=Cucumis melo TaxID=3656 RepID=A0A9I9E4Y9_CUCME